jgi:hypothetical protein
VRIARRAPTAVIVARRIEEQYKSVDKRASSYLEYKQHDDLFSWCTLSLKVKSLLALSRAKSPAGCQR